MKSISKFIKGVYKRVKKEFIKGQNFNIDKNMNPINESIKTYLTMESSGALLITGEWGCGKTYYLKNKLFTKDFDLTHTCGDSFIPIIVSLFGITDLKEIPERVLSAYLDKIGNKVNGGKITSMAKNIFDAIPALNNYVNLDKLLGQGQGIYHLIPTHVLICFDDLERVSEDIKKDKLLGVINELVENKGYKVILIANEDYISSDNMQFKEKVVEKTIKYVSNITDIYFELISSYGDDKFEAFMKNDKIQSSIKRDKYSKSTAKQLSNIRTIKFAITHFYDIFLSYKTEECMNDLTIRKLINQWYFVLFISIESNYMTKI